MKKIKVTKIDAIFSKCVRERANWRCERCMTYYPPGQRQGLHCSHFFSRRHYSIRWHPINAAAHCFSCHQYLGGNPIEFTEWIKAHLNSRYDELTELRCKVVRFRGPDKEEMFTHFKSEFDRMQKLRDKGETGRIEFQPWRQP